MKMFFYRLQDDTCGATEVEAHIGDTVTVYLWGANGGLIIKTGIIKEIL